MAYKAHTWKNGELITLERKTGYDRVDRVIQPNWDDTGSTIAVREDDGQITVEYPIDSRLKEPWQIECRGEQICICANRSLAVYDLSGTLLYFYESKGRIDSACFMADGAVAVFPDVRHDLRDGLFDFPRACRAVVERVQLFCRIRIVP